MGRRLRPAGGRGGLADGGGRQREEGTPIRENPGDDRDMIGQVDGGKGGGQPDEGSKIQYRERNSLGCPAWEESADKQ